MKKWESFLYRLVIFIPGVRHLTGYVAGALKLEYRLFALYAYSGGIVWASVFMTLGYFFSSHWNMALQKVTHYLSF
ncbi:DedA family protein [Rickettsiella massiliensis]|uniref:DedA family protein n=1 Tax=Rickettsiella massiliensis TaxID=676517 RepID=UPI000299DCB1|nr:VTT domain-containing protein [Rickettsiella massiliensis]